MCVSVVGVNNNMYGMHKKCMEMPTYTQSPCSSHDMYLTISIASSMENSQAPSESGARENYCYSPANANTPISALYST